jgi:hypothetical protein
MVILPPHLVVLGLKFAAGRLAHKGVERGIDMAARHHARRGLPAGATDPDSEMRAERHARLAKRAVTVARHMRKS